VPQSQYFVFFGSSSKFINNFQNQFGAEALQIISWRECSKNTSLPHANSTLIICGFDHQAYVRGYISFVEANIDHPYNFLSKNIKRYKRIIYIDTMNSGKLNTYSYYYYAKKELKRKLLLIRGDMEIIELPMVVTRLGWPDFHANTIEKLLAWIILKINKVETIKNSEIARFILEKKRMASSNDYCEHKLLLKHLYRNRLIDKFIRVMRG